MKRCIDREGDICISVRIDGERSCACCSKSVDVSSLSASLSLCTYEVGVVCFAVLSVIERRGGNR